MYRKLCKDCLEGHLNMITDIVRTMDKENLRNYLEYSQRSNCIEDIDETKKMWKGITFKEFKNISKKYNLSTDSGLAYFQEEIENRLKDKNHNVDL